MVCFAAKNVTLRTKPALFSKTRFLKRRFYPSKPPSKSKIRLLYGKNVNDFQSLQWSDPVIHYDCLVNPGQAASDTDNIASLSLTRIEGVYCLSVGLPNVWGINTRKRVSWTDKHSLKCNRQTGKNGYIERYNRTDREEMAEVKRRTDKWLVSYYEERPHQSLGNMTPVEYLLQAA